MKKQIGCKHKDKWCYTYELEEENIDFCKKCEKKLRKQIIEQDKLEKGMPKIKEGKI